MHGPVVSVQADDSLWSAMDVMLSRGLRHLAVVRGDTAVGVLADRELAAVWAMEPLGLKHRHASEVVVAAPSFVGPDVDVVTAAVRMRSQGVDALVVVDDQDRPIGMVTDHDLLGVLAGMLGGEGEVGGPSPRYHGSGRSVLVPD
ncbi:MAG TPA: CBS domain-containing protein [Yinghuangia sp.]|uniref:CBS domain-containing protein n=1 Tax=Yinghuangia sp. YIM S10712 TaxID=3436930 RepID=UPI002D10D28B|nr:CBS domain-containing protein [Yinghuangia sp.]